MKKVIYTEDEIMHIAEKIYSDFEMIFLGKKLPIATITFLARLLEKYPQTEEKKIIVLEYASRIKFEIQNEFSNTNYKLNNEQNNITHRSSFAVKKAINDFYGYNKIENIPEIFESCIENAYFKLISGEYSQKTLKYCNLNQ